MRSWSHALFREGNIPRGDSPKKQHASHLRKVVPTVGVLMGALIVCLLLQWRYFVFLTYSSSWEHAGPHRQVFSGYTEGLANSPFTYEGTLV